MGHDQFHSRVGSRLQSRRSGPRRFAHLKDMISYGTRLDSRRLGEMMGISTGVILSIRIGLAGRYHPTLAVIKRD